MALQQRANEMCKEGQVRNGRARPCERGAVNIVLQRHGEAGSQPWHWKCLSGPLTAIEAVCCGAAQKLHSACYCRWTLVSDAGKQNACSRLPHAQIFVHRIPQLVPFLTIRSPDSDMAALQQQHRAAMLQQQQQQHQQQQQQLYAPGQPPPLGPAGSPGMAPGAPGQPLPQGTAVPIVPPPPPKPTHKQGGKGRCVDRAGAWQQLLCLSVQSCALEEPWRSRTTAFVGTAVQVLRQAVRQRALRGQLRRGQPGRQLCGRPQRRVQVCVCGGGRPSSRAAAWHVPAHPWRTAAYRGIAMPR